MTAGCSLPDGPLPPGGEARATPTALCAAERAYAQEKDAFVADIVAIGFAPGRANRYSHYLGPEA